MLIRGVGRPVSRVIAVLAGVTFVLGLGCKKATSGASQDVFPPDSELHWVNATPESSESPVDRVRAFLKAELAGDERSDDLYIYGCEEDFQPSSDAVKPTRDVEIGDTSVVGDTVVVPVTYSVIGLAHVGAVTYFRRGVRSESVDFRIVPDTTGKTQIFCGDHPANHWSVKTMERYVTLMDSVSAREWKSVVQP